MYSGERFYKKSTVYMDSVRKRKEKIRCHHYIQSFVPGETTPEEAHEIGVAWAKEVFGENRRVIVSTHIDKHHIHNHVAVSCFDDEGDRWHANKASLKRAKIISDRMAAEHGLHVLDSIDKCKNNRSYVETIAKRENNSWKQKMRNDIDKIIMQEDVKSVDDLIKKLEQVGYVVTKKKYISIKSPNAKHNIRSFRLGDGYALEHLQYRIVNKGQEMSMNDVDRYDGVQREYALMLRQMQMVLYRRKPIPQRVLYHDIYKRTELLTFLYQNNIRSEKEFADLINEKDNTYQKCLAEKKNIEDKISEVTRILTDGYRYLELMKKDDLSVEEIDELGRYDHMHKYDISSSIDLEVFKIELSKLQARAEKIEEEISTSLSDRNKFTEYYKTYLNGKTECKVFYDMSEQEEQEMKCNALINNDRSQDKRLDQNVDPR